MGATVTCQKAAAAFRSPAGTPTYVLFESTYQRNVTPHTPSWCCCHVGCVEGALKRVFGYAADCEGGMLQTRRGATTPEAYVADWLRCLTAPSAMPDMAVRLTVGSSYLDTIQPDQVAQAAALLAAHGLAEAARTLQEGDTPQLRLHRDAEVVAALGSTGLAAPWRLIGMTWPPSGPACDAGLGHAPARARRAHPSPPALLKLDDNNLLAQAEDGTWRLAGWAYTIIGDYVRDAWEAELAAPGQHRASIAALRHAARDAPPVPAGTQALVHGVEAMDPRSLRAWAGIKEGCGAKATAAGWVLAAMPEVVSYLVHNLRREHLSWLVPPLDAPPQASLRLEREPPAAAEPA